MNSIAFTAVAGGGINFMPITVGQITWDSPLGAMLSELAGKADTIVEIGTGSALGSTACLVRGMRRHTRLHTYEGDQSQMIVAAANIKLMNTEGLNMTLHHGILHRGIVPYWHPKPNQQTFECWVHEKQVIETAPVTKVVVPFIDLLVLDGGEFTSFGDFMLLWPLAQHIILDDSNKEVAAKNWLAARYLKQSAWWECVREELEDRNGWHHFRRKN